jgi:hypothetical protein
MFTPVRVLPDLLESYDPGSCTLPGRMVAGDAGPSIESGPLDRAGVEAFFDEAVPA